MEGENRIAIKVDTVFVVAKGALITLNYFSSYTEYDKHKEKAEEVFQSFKLVD